MIMAQDNAMLKAKREFKKPVFGALPPIEKTV
jgi:hypothetical protein